jgi:hypothetical protein
VVNTFLWVLDSYVNAGVRAGLRPAHAAQLHERALARPADGRVAAVGAVRAPAAPAAGQLGARLPRTARVHVVNGVPTREICA